MMAQLDSEKRNQALTLAQVKYQQALEEEERQRQAAAAAAARSSYGGGGESGDDHSGSGSYTSRVSVENKSKDKGLDPYAWQNRSYGSDKYAWQNRSYGGSKKYYTGGANRYK